jgi:putative FmdB family regulatory protein
MPIYEFECVKCGERVEILRVHYLDDKVVENCPPCKKCNGVTKRTFSVPLVTYSGDGFYTTDSKSSPSPSEGSRQSDSGSLVE